MYRRSAVAGNADERAGSLGLAARACAACALALRTPRDAAYSPPACLGPGPSGDETSDAEPTAPAGQLPPATGWPGNQMIQIIG